MGWFRKIIRLVRIKPFSSKGQAEIILLKFLINDIQRQIKAIEHQRKSLIKREGKLHIKFNGTNEENDRQLIAYEEEKKNLDEHLTIFRKKLKLTEARYDKIISLTARGPESAVKKEVVLK